MSRRLTLSLLSVGAPSDRRHFSATPTPDPTPYRPPGTTDQLDSPLTYAFDHPMTYEIAIQTPTGRYSALRVHHSRCIAHTRPRTTDIDVISRSGGYTDCARETRARPRAGVTIPRTDPFFRRAHPTDLDDHRLTTTSALIDGQVAGSPAAHRVGGWVEASSRQFRTLTGLSPASQILVSD